MSHSEGIILFIDRSLGGRLIAKALTEAGASVEIHDAHFSETTQDIEWIERVSKQRWVILTKDQKIRERPSERKAIKESNARIFILGAGNLRGAEMAEILTDCLPNIYQFVLENPAPFVAKIHKSREIKPREDAASLLH